MDLFPEFPPEPAEGIFLGFSSESSDDEPAPPPRANPPPPANPPLPARDAEPPRVRRKFIERVHYFDELNDQQFRAKFRIGKLTCLMVLGKIKDKIEPRARKIKKKDFLCYIQLCADSH